MKRIAAAVLLTAVIAVSAMLYSTHGDMTPSRCIGVPEFISPTNAPCN